jgi:ribosomal protein S18 acetylase RimI-like enzyme
MKADDLRVTQVNSVHESAFAALERIYTESLPESERKSPARLSIMLGDPSYRFLVATSSATVVGFSIVRIFDNSDAALLEYMAVAREHRSQGIGRILFSRTANFDCISSHFLLAEVDSDKMPSEDEADRFRRKAFYRGLGCKEVDQLRYIMPPVSTELPPDMDILVYKQDLPTFIERTRLKQWLQRCYVEVYGLSENDPRIETMIQGLPARVQLI